MDYDLLPNEVWWYVLDACDNITLGRLARVNHRFMDLIIEDRIVETKEMMRKCGDKLVKVTYSRSFLLERVIEGWDTELISFVHLYSFGGPSVRELIESGVNYYVPQIDFRKLLIYLFAYKKIKIPPENWIIDEYFNPSSYDCPPIENIKIILDNDSYTFDLAPSYVDKGVMMRKEGYEEMRALFVEKGSDPRKSRGECSSFL